MNAVAVKRANRTRAWYNPMLDFETGYFVAVFLVAFVILTFLYFYYHHIFSDDVYVYVPLYAHLGVAVVAIVSFYFLIDSVGEAYEIQRATVSFDVTQAFTTAIFSAWPATDRLLKQMFRDDPEIQRIPPPTVPVDPNFVAYANTLMVRLFFYGLDSIVRLQPAQDERRLREWRRWMENSEILRHGWAAQRPLEALVTSLAVDQNLFAGESRRPPLTLYARAVTRNPVRFAGIVIACVSVVFVIFYVVWAVWYAHGDNVYERTKLFVEIVECFYVSVVFIAIFFKEQIEVEDTRFNELNRAAEFEIEVLFNNYPQSLPVYQSLNRCHPDIQALVIPPDINVTASLVYAAGAHQSLLLSLELQLELNGDKLPPHSIRLFRQYFLDPGMRSAWRSRRAALPLDTVEYVERELYCKAECCVYAIPPQYAPIPKPWYAWLRQRVVAEDVRRHRQRDHHHPYTEEEEEEGNVADCQLDTCTRHRRTP